MTLGQAAAPRKLRRIDGDVQAKIESMALRRWTPAQIHRHLKAEAGTVQGKNLKRVPHIRTVRDIVKEAAPPDLSGAWSLSESDPDQVAAGLDMLAIDAEINGTGQPSVVSKALVERVAHIRNGRPGIRPRSLEWIIGTTYLALEARQSDTRSTDTFLAYAPWLGWEEQRAYFTAIHNRRIDAAPMVMLDHVVIDFLSECSAQVELGGDVRIAELYDSDVLREQIPILEHWKGLLCLPDALQVESEDDGN